jgi:hypothetical protein
VDLFLDLINPIPRLSLRGLDLEAVLLGGGRKKTTDRMFLPIRGFHDLGQGRSLGPPDQFQDLCARALGARRAGFLGLGGFGLPAGLGFLLRFGGLSAFLGFGRALLLAGPLLRGRLLRRDVRALFRRRRRRFR